MIKLLFAFCLLLALAGAEYDSYKPYLRTSRASYANVGFASYGGPVHSFGGYNGEMPVVGYGPPIGPHVLHKRSADAALRTAVSTLLYRNDTMCLGLIVCQHAREDPQAASLLKTAFSATRDLQGVNFVQYAIAQAQFPSETCEEVFAPCSQIQKALSEALDDVKTNVKIKNKPSNEESANEELTAAEPITEIFTETIPQEENKDTERN